MKKDIKLVLVSLAVAATAGPAFSQNTAPVSGAPSPAVAGMVKTLQQVCVPVLKGGALRAAASAAGFRLKDGQWVLPISGDRRIELAPPDEANPHVCSAAVYAKPDSQAALRQAVNTWAAAQSPPLALATEPPGAATPGWSTSSWRGQTPAGTLGVALGQAQPAQARSPAVLESDLQVSLTPA
jgi:hypothetical protein